jgi:hypothetical protein
MIISVKRRDDAEYLAPAAMVWFLRDTKTGRITGAGYLVAAVVLGLLLGATDASTPVVVGVLSLFGVSIPLIMFPLAVREQKARETR